MKSRVAAVTAVLLAQSGSAQVAHTPPEPLSPPSRWFHVDDYPAASLRGAEEGGVSVVLSIDEKGMVTGCRVTHSSSHPALDNVTCVLAVRRGRFEPATDAQRRPTVGSYAISDVAWRMQGLAAPSGTSPSVRVGRPTSSPATAPGEHGFERSDRRTAELPSEAGEVVTGPADPGADARTAKLIVDEFDALCLGDASTAAAIQRQAEAAGWRSPGGDADLTMTRGTDVLRLKISETMAAGQTREACSVRTSRIIPALVDEAQGRLGFVPAFRSGASGTFFVVREAHGLRSAAELGNTAALSAKQAGRFYSVMVLVADGASQLLALHTSGDSQ